MVGLALLFAGLMPVLAAGVDTVTRAAPPEQAGSAAALSETTQELGGALGIALLGSVSTAVYRFQLQPLLSPLPAREQASADSLAGALNSKPPLPWPILDAAAQAFTAGLHAASAVAAGLVVLTVVAAVFPTRRLRRPQASCGDAPEHQPVDQ